MAKNNRYCDNLSRSREKESEVQLLVRDLKGRWCGIVLAVAAVMVHLFCSSLALEKIQ